MVERILKARIQAKYDTLENWDKITREDNFFPLKGEILWATARDNNELAMYKIGIKDNSDGDGVNFVDLPWIKNNADQNINDENSPAYIKNRTHYEYEEIANILSLKIPAHIPDDSRMVNIEIDTSVFVLDETYGLKVDLLLPGSEEPAQSLILEGVCAPLETIWDPADGAYPEEYKNMKIINFVDPTDSDPELQVFINAKYENEAITPADNYIFTYNLVGEDGDCVYTLTGESLPEVIEVKQKTIDKKYLPVDMSKKIVQDYSKHYNYPVKLDLSGASSGFTSLLTEVTGQKSGNNYYGRTKTIGGSWVDTGNVDGMQGRYYVESVADGILTVSPYAGSTTQYTIPILDGEFVQKSIIAFDVADTSTNTVSAREVINGRRMSFGHLYDMVAAKKPKGYNKCTINWVCNMHDWVDLKNIRSFIGGLVMLSAGTPDATDSDNKLQYVLTSYACNNDVAGIDKDIGNISDLAGIAGSISDSEDGTTAQQALGFYQGEIKIEDSYISATINTGVEGIYSSTTSSVPDGSGSDMDAGPSANQVTAIITKNDTMQPTFETFKTDLDDEFYLNIYTVRSQDLKLEIIWECE